VIVLVHLRLLVLIVLVRRVVPAGDDGLQELQDGRSLSISVVDASAGVTEVLEVDLGGRRVGDHLVAGELEGVNRVQLGADALAGGDEMSGRSSATTSSLERTG
jgi:hypothetical protein